MLLVGELELGRGVVLEDGAGVVALAPLAGLPARLELYVLLHALHYLPAAIALEEQAPEISGHLHHLPLVEAARVEGLDVSLGDRQPEGVREGVPGYLLEGESRGSDVQRSLGLLIVGHQLAAVL